MALEITPFQQEFKTPAWAYTDWIYSIQGFHLTYKGFSSECISWDPEALPALEKELQNPKLQESLEEAFQNKVSFWEYSVPSTSPTVRFAWSSLLLQMSQPTPPSIGVHGFLNLSAESFSEPDLLQKLQAFQDQGLTHLKIKVSDETLPRLALVSQFGGFQWRLDGNQNLSFQNALVLQDFYDSIEYLEEPFESLTETEQFFEKTQIPWAADENLPHLKSSSPGLAALIVKPSLIGDFTDLKKLIQNQIAPLIVSSSYETDIGLKSLMAWAQALNPQGLHGLATHSLFQTPSSLEIQKGRLHEK